MESICNPLKMGRYQRWYTDCEEMWHPKSKTLFIWDLFKRRIHVESKPLLLVNLTAEKKKKKIFHASTLFSPADQRRSKPPPPAYNPWLQTSVTAHTLLLYHPKVEERCSYLAQRFFLDRVWEWLHHRGGWGKAACGYQRAPGWLFLAYGLRVERISTSGAPSAL